MKDLYPFIFKRKSIRRYKGPIKGRQLKKVHDLLDSLEPLTNGIGTEFQIISNDDVKTFIQRPAPYYIAAFSEKNKRAKVNVGFMLQQMDLRLSSMGIGSCWQGIPKLKSHVKSQLEFIILLAFGEPAEPLHRKHAEFKRKSLYEITDIKGMDRILEAVRLAPSAANNQPWFLKGEENMIHVYQKIPNILKVGFIGRWNPIDMGIALAHLKITLEHYGYKPKFEIYKNPPKLEKHEYIGTMKI
ncbi:MAG TPA: nitroreductase [Methanothermobacter sp.]|jgi:nitroreductase|nr:nitroreductase [Methanothermobacter sp.]